MSLAYRTWTKINEEWRLDKSFDPPSPYGNYGRVIYKASPDSDEKLYVDIKTPADMFHLCAPSSSDVIHTTIDNVELNGDGDTNVIIGIEIGPDMSILPDYFMANCQWLSEPIRIPGQIKEIKDYVFYSSSSTPVFNAEVKIDDGVERIGERFMGYQRTFNQPISLPNTLKKIGDGFLTGARAFNRQIEIPTGLTRIGGNFMYDWSSFNQRLELPNNITHIGDHFMDGCASFNQPLELSSNLVYIGENFMNGCIGFNQPLTLPQKLAHVGKSFLMNMQELAGKFNRVDIGSLSADVFEQGGSFSSKDGWSPSYIVGVYIKGDHADDMVEKFINTNVTSEYRKIVKYVEGDWGHITYWDGAEQFAYKTLYMTSQADWNALGNNSTSSTTTMTVQGVTLTKGGNNAIRSISIGKSVTSLPNYFLYYCVKMVNEQIDLSNVKTIGSYFMAYTTHTGGIAGLGAILYMPPAGASVGNYFMTNSGFSSEYIYFNGVFTMPNYFMRNLYNFIGSVYATEDLYTMLNSLSSTYRKNVFSAYSTSVNSYTRGIKITGPYAAQVKALLPNSTTSPYRKLN